MTKKEFHKLLADYCSQGTVTVRYCNFAGDGWNKEYWFKGNPVLSEYKLPFVVDFLCRTRYASTF